MKKIFLGGPIQYGFGEKGKFDENLKNIILQTINFLEKSNCIVYSAHLVENFEKNIDTKTYYNISKRDYNWMLNCDVYIAILSSNNKNSIIRSDGTFIEIGWAYALNKPIILIMDDGVLENASDLLKCMVDEKDNCNSNKSIV